ncbi:MAG: hypothetical protein AB7O59_22360 [Pirellulales bacterium]
MASLNDIKSDGRARMARAKNLKARSDRRIRDGFDVNQRVAKAAIDLAKSLLSPAPLFVSRFHGKAHMPGRGHWPEGMSDEEYFAMVRREEHEAEQREKEFLERVGQYEFPPALERPWLTVQGEIDELRRRMSLETDQRHIDEYVNRIEALQKIEDILAHRRARTVPREWIAAYIESYATFWGELIGKPQDLSGWKPDWQPTAKEIREGFGARAH